MVGSMLEDKERMAIPLFFPPVFLIALRVFGSPLVTAITYISLAIYPRLGVNHISHVSLISPSSIPYS